ncbi:MAG: T9SS type A sorting domain-containing protein, partial [Bacteroidota bacterium]
GYNPFIYESSQRILSGKVKNIYVLQAAMNNDTRILSLTVVDEPIPGKPAFLSASPSSRSVTLRWRKNAELDVMRYRVYQGLAADALSLRDSSLSRIDTSIVVRNLDNARTYFFAVSAVDSELNESEFSNVLFARPEGNPLVALSANGLSFGNVSIGTAKDLSFTVQNSGNDTLQVLSMETLNPAFTLSSASFNLGPGKSIVQSARFQPSAVGTVISKILLASNSQRRYDTLTVSGAGVNTLPSSQILSIMDVPDDNGKQVFVRWKTSARATTNGVRSFGVWRLDTIWTFLSEALATSDSVFQTVASTVQDSTKSKGMKRTVFRITAHSGLADFYTTSARDSGYSLDNIPPSQPINLQLEAPNKNEVIVHWSKPDDADLSGFVVERSTTVDFTVGGTVRTSVIDTVFIERNLVGGTRFYYRIIAIDSSGNESSPSAARSVIVTGVAGELGLPTEYSLSDNYPNPFNPSTTIRFGLPVRSHVTLDIYNILGQRVAVLADEQLEAGVVEKTWSTTVSSGLYFYRLEAVAVEDNSRHFIGIRKMFLVK